MGVLLPSAASIISLTLPRVVSSPTFVTLTSRRPVRFWVPAKTSSPGPLSIGNDSPVIDAWFTDVSPLMISPSMGKFSPGLTAMTSFMASSNTSVSISAPLTIFRVVCGVSFISSSIERCAPLAVLDSIIIVIRRKNAIIPAVRKSDPVKAARIASATSSFMYTFPL